MRKLTAAGAAAALLTSTLSAPAWAAAPEAPTDVQVSWAENGQIRITWKDNGEANQVVAAFPDTGYRLALPTADAPNELLVNPGRFNEAPKVRISVRTIGTDEALSEPAHSPTFDTHRAPALTIGNAEALSTTSVRVSWQRDPFVDENPNDPLDQLNGTWANAVVSGPAEGQETEFEVRGGVSTADVPVRRGPLTISLRTGNEWGWAPLGVNHTVGVGTMSVTSPVSTPTHWSGISWNTRLLAHFPEIVDEVFPVEVQARANSSSPWKKAGWNAGQIDGKLFFPSAGAAGGMEYRIWVPAGQIYRGNILTVTPPVSTKAQFIRKYSFINNGGYHEQTARVGVTVHRKISVAPGLAMKAALHIWNGKEWRYVRAVQLDSKGKADLAIRAAGRGTTQKYRIVTPPVKVNGLPVELSTSDAFTLKVV